MRRATIRTVPMLGTASKGNESKAPMTRCLRLRYRGWDRRAKAFWKRCSVALMVVWAWVWKPAEARTAARFEAPDVIKR
jgi:hypothetical protein